MTKVNDLNDILSQVLEEDKDKSSKINLAKRILIDILRL